jgi:hypothetical protein
MPTLTPSPALAAAGEAFNATCDTDGAWCGLTHIATFRLAPAPRTQNALQTVVTTLLAQDPALTAHGVTFAEGRTLTRASLADTLFFGTRQNPGGPELQDVIETFAGHREFSAWYFERKIPCDACTEHTSLAVLYFAQAELVVVIKGYWGHDQKNT